MIRCRRSSTRSAFSLPAILRVPSGACCSARSEIGLGRTRALQLSIFLMAVPTTLIAFLPTHATVGVLAPVLLVILRLAQGISVGGEFIGSCCYLVEAAPSGRRGLFGSWSTFGTIGGMLLGSAVATLIQDVLSPEQIHAWGWRLPFLGGYWLASSAGRCAAVRKRRRNLFGCRTPGRSNDAPGSRRCGRCRSVYCKLQASCCFSESVFTRYSSGCRRISRIS